MGCYFPLCRLLPPPTVSVPELLWRTVPRPALAWRDWNGDVCVRNHCSGNTHLLGPLAGRVLLVLAARGSAATVADLAAAIEAPAAVQASDWSASIEDVLSEFERLGLVMPEVR